jgi:hypothetical protein
MRYAPLRRTAAKLTTLALALALLSGCGSASPESDEAAEVGPVRAGSVASLAQCSDWVAGSREERIATLHDIRAQVNQTGAEPTTDIGDDEAYAILQRTCSRPYASGFRLYKLYTRAAAFSSLTGKD